MLKGQAGGKLLSRKTPLRVLLADDHPIVRSGIRNELARHADIEVVGEAVSGEEALQLTEALEPDVLILDIAMPGLKAAQVIRQLRERSPSPGILVLTAYGGVDNVLGMLQAGATGYLLKDEDPTTIVEGVRAVARGRPWLSPAVARALAGQTAKGEPLLVGAALSLREREVLRLLARGWDNRQIARELSIETRTVRYHLRNIYAKLGVRGRGEAIARAAREGWGEE